MKTNRHEARRTEILAEMSGIRSMRKGTVSEQYNKVKRKDGRVVKNGPYFILTKKEPGGKTITESIPGEELERMRAEADNYKSFRQLADEYVQVCEQISLHENTDASTGEQGKKNGKSG